MRTQLAELFFFCGRSVAVLFCKYVGQSDLIWDPPGFKTPLINHHQRRSGLSFDIVNSPISRESWAQKSPTIWTEYWAVSTVNNHHLFKIQRDDRLCHLIFHVFQSSFTWLWQNWRIACISKACSRTNLQEAIPVFVLLECYICSSWILDIFPCLYKKKSAWMFAASQRKFDWQLLGFFLRRRNTKLQNIAPGSLVVHHGIESFLQS